VDGRHGWRECLPAPLKPRERIVAVEQSGFAAEARALDFEQAELGRDAAGGGKSAGLPAGGGDAVARHDDGERVSPQRLADPAPALGSPSLAAMSP
jgi:hypothetical protein